MSNFHITTLFTRYGVENSKQSIEIIFRDGPTSNISQLQFYCQPNYRLQQYSHQKNTKIEIPMVIDMISMCPTDKEFEYRQQPNHKEELIIEFSQKHIDGEFYILQIE